MVGALLLFVLPVSCHDLYNGNYAPILTWKRVVAKFPWELILFVGGLTSITALADVSLYFVAVLVDLFKAVINPL